MSQFLALTQTGCRRLISRRLLQRLTTSPFLLLAVAVLQAVLPATVNAAPKKPNIVLVMADDMGYSDLGCYGSEIRTPHVDSLAAGGLRFRQFYNNSVCGPTRASLLTGLYCQQIGHSGRHWNQPKDFSKCVTIAEVLQHSGYRTMMVGKWQGRDLAVRRGFDRFFGPNCQAKISYFDEVEMNPYSLNNQPWKVPQDDFFMTDAFIDHAVEFLDEASKADKPFFLYVAYIAPHWPLHARERDIASYRSTYRQTGWDEWRATRFAQQRETGLLKPSWELSPKPAGVPAWQDDKHKDWQAERMAAYAAQVSAVDTGVGRVLESLRKTNSEENTLVMFLSDNGAAPNGGIGPTTSGFGFGPNAKNDKWRLDGAAIKPGSGPENMPGPHDTFAAYGLAWCNVSNTPLRGEKSSAWEGGIRTPLIVRWPEVIRERGRFTDDVGHVIDVMATCLDVAQTPYPEQFHNRRPLPLEGKSLLPTFRGREREGHEVLCWSVPGNQAIRMGDWKLVSAARGKPWQLYDLAADATETTNLASRHPERVQEMTREFQQWEKRVGAK